MKKDEKKLEDKEKENDELMSDLEQLQKEVENSSNMSDLEKEQVARLIKAIGIKAKRGPNVLARIGAFIITIIFNFIAFYLAYGVLYKYIAVSRLNALYLIAGLSVLKALIRMLTVCIKSTYKRLEFSIYVYITLVLGIYLFSNLKIMMSFNSFIDIIIFYLLAQALFEMMSITYTKINLMRMVR